MLKTIKTKIIATYSLVMIAFISTLLLTTLINEKDHILGIALKNSSKISNMHAELLNKEFSNYIAILKILSSSPQIQSEDIDNIPFLLKNLIEVSKGDFINAIYINKNSDLIDASGNKSKAPSNLFLPEQIWLEKDHYITHSMANDFEATPVIFVSVPVFNGQNQLSGTLVVAVPISIISEKLSSIKVFEGSYAWISDSENVVVSHPNKEYLMRKLAPSIDEKFVGLFPIIEQTKQQESGYGRYYDKSTQNAKIVTFSKVHNLPDWNFFISTLEPEIFSNIYKVAYNVLAISFFLIIIFLLIIINLSGKITKPLIKLTRDVKSSVDNKNRHFEVIHSNDEIGELSKAFCDTLQKIHLHTHYLEEMVNDRTQEISAKNLQLSEKNNKLEKIASVDPLTKLYNRRAFSALVDKEIARSTEHDFPATLIILDIDHFKKINDQFGHDIGDDVLSNFAHELSVYSRKDLICRWGGEEFVILLSNASFDEASAYVERLQEKISETNFDPIGRLTFSAGIASMQPEESFKEWFHRADKALLTAKSSGRNRVEWAK